jgi:molecular chaperone IbpA
MRTFDLSPLYRSTVGFDRLFSMLDQASGFEAGGSPYPPYNIERTGENAYRVTLAVAGFSDAELSIEAKENTLTVKGEKVAKTDEKKAEVLYQGIAARAFERVFRLADHVEVKAAALENGLLHIDLVREIPEAMKPRTIRINGGTNKVLETKVAAYRAPCVYLQTCFEAPRFAGALFCAYSSGAIGTMVTAGGFAGAEVAGIAGRSAAAAAAGGFAG